MKHFVSVAILVAISTLLVKTGLDAVGLLPVEASAQAVPIDRLFNLHFWLISFLFSLIVVFRRKPGETGEGKHFGGNPRLEIFWTLAPLATVLYIAYVGAGTLAETRRIDPQAMLVKVTAGQWFWKFEYPDLGVTSTTLNLPVNNAGVDVYGYFYDTDWAQELDMIQLNLVSLTQLTKLLLADMRQQQYGRILNLGSTGSFVPSPLNTVYAASKAYVWSFSAALAEELAGTGITATVLCPGATRTQFQARAHIENIRLLRFGVMEAASVA